MAWTRPKLDEEVASMSVVNHAVKREANGTLSRVRSIAAPHSKSGELLASIKMKRANDKDYVVYTTDPNALSKNYGHFTEDGSKWVEGIHFIERGINGW
ncbi:DUF5403 family protein (plasmid) [Streptomyces sp. BI20]|uniref:DUF5403 family protein n=1 Tax=Streptomyces sp. BI20 TaxID=3403460 RepID=UPI003C76EE88